MIWMNRERKSEKARENGARKGSEMTKPRPIDGGHGLATPLALAVAENIASQSGQRRPTVVQKTVA